MKTTLLTLALLFLPLINISAQWEILNEGFKGSINTIDFVNEDIGWIAGSNGTLSKTTDGGENWINIPIDEIWNISQIDFFNESVGWAIGGAYDPDFTDFIWKTTDGGNAWSQQFSSPVFNFNSLYVIDATNVFVVGGDTIFKTTNGGTNWIDVSPNLPERNYNSVWFQDAQTGVVVGSYNDGTADRGIILRTSNGGNTWSETIINVFNSLYDIQFLNSTNGYFRANLDTTNFICKTEDMCLSWTVKTQHPYSISSYQFLDNNTTYAIMGDSITRNNIMRSTDGSVTWQNLQAHNIDWCGLYKIYFNKINNGFILGSTLSNSGVLFKSNDSGYNWRMEIFSYALNDVCFINKDTGFIVGWDKWGGSHGSFYEGRIFSTFNGGKTWIHKYYTYDVFRSCIFVNEIEGFALTSGVVGIGSLRCGIIKTTDSGDNWNSIYVNNIDSTGFGFYGNDICFMDENIGWVVGYYSVTDTGGAGILGTFNGGQNWELVKKFPDTGSLYSILTTDSTGWAVGEDGMIVKYTEQTSWILRPSVTTLPLNKVYFYDENNGWISGGYINATDFQHILLKTSNAGENWTTVQNINYLINDLCFYDLNIGWAVGNDTTYKGVILETKDGGTNWSVAVDNLFGPLNSIYIKDNYAWAVGWRGLVLRTKDAGLTWIDDNNKVYPTEFKLEQNYPNPFNPTTTIKYKIPLGFAASPFSKGGIKGGFVTLKVYDVLGREVATLVNEEQPAGVYEVEFDSKTLSSGIYFYALRAGSYASTKKMILLK